MARRPPTPDEIAAQLRALSMRGFAEAIARAGSLARRDPRAFNVLLALLDRAVREHPELPALRGFRAVVARLRGPRGGRPG